MRLQKQLSRKSKNRVYDKWVIVIPSKVVKEADFKEGDEFKAETKKWEIRLKKK